MYTFIYIYIIYIYIMYIYILCIYSYKSYTPASGGDSHSAPPGISVRADVAWPHRLPASADPSAQPVDVRWITTGRSNRWPGDMLWNICIDTAGYIYINIIIYIRIYLYTCVCVCAWYDKNRYIAHIYMWYDKNKYIYIYVNVCIYIYIYTYAKGDVTWNIHEYTLEGPGRSILDYWDDKLGWRWKITGISGHIPPWKVLINCWNSGALAHRGISRVGLRSLHSDMSHKHTFHPLYLRYTTGSA